MMDTYLYVNYGVQFVVCYICCEAPPNDVHTLNMINNWR